MPTLGTFSGGGLGFGAVFTLQDNFSRQAANIRRSFGSIEAATEQAVAKVNAGIQRMTHGFSMLAAGAVIALPLAFGVKASMAFDTQLSATAATARATAEEFQLLRANALEMGEGTAFSAKQAAEAQEFLALAGFNTNKIIAAMPGLLDLAAATTTNLGTAADIASDTLTALGLKTSEMNSLADVLAKTTVTANTNLIQMGEALKFAASGAAKVGATKEELAALVGMMGDIGLKGTLAGTSINQFFQRLIKVPTTDKAVAALDRLGLGVDAIVDSAGNLRSIRDITGTLREALKGIQGNVDQGAILTDLFGIRGQRVMDAILSKSAKNFDDYVASLENSAGEAQAIAKQKLENLGGDFTLLSSAVETTLIKIGAAITPFIRPIIQGFTKMVTVFGKLVDTPLGKFILIATGAFAGFLVVAGLVNILSGALTFSIGMLANTMLRFGLQSVATAFMAQGLTAGFAALGAAVWTALAPLLPFIAAAAAIVAGGWAMYKAITISNEAFDNFLAGKEERATGVRLAFQRIGGVIKAGLAIWRSFNTETGEFKLTKTMVDALDALGIKDFVLGLAPFITKLKTVVAQVVDVLSKFWDQIVNVAGSIKEALIPNLEWAEVAGWGLLTVAGLMAAALVGVAVSIIVAMLPVIAVLGAVGLAIWAVVKGVQLLRDNWSTWVDSAKNFGQRLVQGIKDGISSAWSSFLTWIQQKWSEVPLLGSMFGGVDNTQPGSITNGNSGSSVDSNGLLNSSAELSAMRFSSPPPTVLNNQSTVVKSVTVVSEIDSEEVSRRVIDIQDTELERSID
jgi:TP901 family phage tail tape measure protein